MMYHSKLHKRSWCLGSPSSILPGAILHDTTLLPFFDEKGCLKQALLFHHRKQRVYYLESCTGSIFRSKLTIRTLNSDRLIPYSMSSHVQRKALYSLYHFDPWWLLKKPAYRNIQGVEELKQTNIAHHEANVCILKYDLTKGHIARMFDARARELSLSSLLLSQDKKSKSRVPVQMEASMQWVLDPAWDSKC